MAYSTTEKADRLRALALQFRGLAKGTELPLYQARMLAAAAELDNEADTLAGDLEQTPSHGLWAR